MFRNVLVWFVYALASICAVFALVYGYNIYVIESGDPLTEAPGTTHFADVQGERLAYSEVNNGADTTVLFVGGLSAWNGTWRRVIDVQNSRTKRYNYIALDLPPFGYSTPDRSRDYFRDTQAQRIAAFIEKKDLRSVILVGHSYGGGPMTEYAMRDPKRVEKLILIDAVLNAGEHKTTPSFSPVDLTPLRSGIVGLLIHSDLIVLNRLRSFVYVRDNIDSDLAHLYTRYFNTRGVTQRLSRWAHDYVHDPLVYTSTDMNAYKVIPFPVRLIWGEQDTLTPLSGAQALLQVIPDVHLHRLSNIGHIPMIEDYAAFDEALADALDK